MRDVSSRRARARTMPRRDRAPRSMRAVRVVARVLFLVVVLARASAASTTRPRSEPVGSFGETYVPDATFADAIDDDRVVAMAAANEFIVPGSVWARALDEATTTRRKAREREKVLAEAERASAETREMEEEVEREVEAEMAAKNSSRDDDVKVEAHSERFMNWLAKRPERAKRYCGDEAPPCAESARREKIFNENVARVDRHNAQAGKNGMRMSVGNFADLTPEEFEHRHATAYERRVKAKVELGVAALGEASAHKGSRDHGTRTDTKPVVEERPVRDDERSERPRTYSSKRAKHTHGDALVQPEEPPIAHGELNQHFAAFVDRYGKQKQYCPDVPYPCDEVFKRQKVFLKNLRDIELTNAKGGMKKRVTRFADLESDEFAHEHATYANVTVGSKKQRRNMAKLGDLSQADMRALHAQRPHALRGKVSFHKIKPRTDVNETSTLGKWEYRSAGFNESFDWRKKIDLGPIYSQGMCSGCWAFSTAQVVADSKTIASGARVAVSPHHLLSCDNLDSACNTGNMATAYSWINVQPKGMLLAADFPEGSSCEVANEPSTRGVKIDGYCEIPPLQGVPTVLNIMRALKQQTVAVGLNIKPLQLYGGGIVRTHDCPPASSDPLLAINHAAVLVGWGYDDESKQPYWIMKNSYDSDWGEEGYAKLSMELGVDGYGTCGLYTEQNYPLTDGRACVEGSMKKWSVKRGNDVYLEPDDVLVLPNGRGLITPFKFEIFGYDLTDALQFAAMFCFSLCFILLLIELYFCLFPELDDGDQSEEAVADGGKSPSVGSSLLRDVEKGGSAGYGADADAEKK